MGNCSSAPFDEAAFLQPHEAEETNMLPPSSLGTTTIAFPSGLTRGEGRNSLKTTETTVDAAADLLEVGTAVQVENPGGASMVASAPQDEALRARWPVRITGAKSLERVRFELRDAAGAVLGLIVMKKCASDKEVKDCVLLVCSTVPRVAGQAEACDWKVQNRGGMKPAKNAAVTLSTFEKTFACLFTTTRLAMSSGEALYPWALLVPDSMNSMRDGHRVYLANKQGGFTTGKANQAYYGASTSIASSKERHYKKGGAGCAVLRADADGRTTLRVAPGIDPLLMLAIALLHEKSALNEHFTTAGSGGGM